MTISQLPPPCACIEFHPTEHKRHAFHSSQLIDYTQEPNPEAGDDKNAPPQKLALVLSTADVVSWERSFWPRGVSL